MFVSEIEEVEFLQLCKLFTLCFIVEGGVAVNNCVPARAGGGQIGLIVGKIAAPDGVSALFIPSEIIGIVGSLHYHIVDLRAGEQ